MSGIRSIRAQARLDLHEAMQVEAYYYHGGDLTIAPVRIFVRVHTKFVEIPLKGGGKDLSSHFKDTTPKIIFEWSKLPAGMPVKSSLVSVAPGEVYKVQVADPRDGFTVKASVSRVLRDEEAGMQGRILYPEAL